MNTGKEYINEAYRAIFRKDYRKAIELFKKAIVRDPNTPSYYYKLSITYARNNNLIEAMSAVKEATRLRPDCEIFQQHKQVLQGRILTNQAMAVAEKSSTDPKGLELLEQAIQCDPLNSSSRLLYAFLLDKHGKTEDAVQALEELLAFDPLNLEAKELLLQCQQKKQ
jgi:cytochrome c-type biogenesis protein CcmH/NrfG